MKALHQKLVLPVLAALSLTVHPVLTRAQATPTTQELYVKPTEYTPCPEPCHTLDQYMQNATRYFVSNTVFNFLPGMHPMRQALSVCNISNLSMVTTSGTANITCQSYTELSFSEIYNLTMKDLTLYVCTSLMVRDVADFTLLRVTIQPFNRLPIGSLLSITNVFGTSVISEFREEIQNAYPRLMHITVWYSDDYRTIQPVGSQNHLTFRDFSLVCPSKYGCTPLFLGLYQSTYAVNIGFENVTMTANSVDITIEIGSETRNSIGIIDSRFHDSGGIDAKDSSLRIPRPVTSNSSLHMRNCHFDHCILNLYLDLATTEVVLEDCVISRPLGDPKPNSPFILFPPQGASLTISNLNRLAIITNTTFTTAQSNDVCNRGSEFFDSVPPSVVSLYNARHIQFRGCKFRNNERASTLTVGNVVSLVNTHDVTFSECEFSGNKRSAIAAYDSTFVFKDKNSFVGNSATQGAAIGFYGDSVVKIQHDTYVLFQNNSAEDVGGAIAVKSYFIPPASKCFFEILNPPIPDFCDCEWYQEPTNISFSFLNNKARNGGNDIYGASLDSCLLKSPLAQCCRPRDILSVFFNLPGMDHSAITSDPLRVCLCRNGQPDCTEVFTNLSCYPGEYFQIPAVIVGDTFGTVHGSAYAYFLPLNDTYGSSTLGDLQQSQYIQNQCNNLTYTVFSRRNDETLVLSANSAAVESYPSQQEISFIVSFYQSSRVISSVLRTLPIFMNISLLPCPLGFVLSEESHGCICDPQLEENNIPCNLSTQTVRRSGTVWVNASFKDGRANGVIVNKHCPHYYCKREAVNVDLEYPDSQCAFHRSGILCGGCQSGLSLTLGSAQCLPCSNHFLALLIPFAVAGFALVFFLKVLNLTVAVGTINGLIFYANIVQANQDEWLPAEHNILTAFIAWFNLDLGIETCFFDGLDDYWKTWLQFVFPLYIWAIMTVVIILSHKYSTVAKIVGGNSVPVLATLFLLSYAKHLRIIISILQTSNLNYPDGTTRAVWTYDGNISYLSPKHIPMFVLALLVLVVLGVPYTLFLLFAQCIQRMDSQILRRVLIRLKPFLDAYFGPLRDKHRYWVGLLLLVRCVLITVISATPTNQSSVSLMIAAVTVCTLIMDPYIGHVYKRNYLNLLENSLFLNLGVLAIGTLYIRESGGNQAALAYTCVGVAFAQFVTIIVFHTATAIHSTGLIQRYCQCNREQEGNASEGADLIEENQHRVRGVSVTMQGEYREPLLKYLDDQDYEPQPPP